MNFDERLTELTDWIGNKRGWSLGQRFHFHLLVLDRWPHIDWASSDKERESVIDEIIQEVDKGGR